MTRDEWKEVERSLNNPMVRLAMRARCEETHHEWENGMTAFFQLVETCKWCGERKLFR